MARLAMPPIESSTIFIDDPSTKNHPLGARQIEVRCVYLEDILGKICYLFVKPNPPNVMRAQWPHPTPLRLLTNSNL